MKKWLTDQAHLKGAIGMSKLGMAFEFLEKGYYKEATSSFLLASGYLSEAASMSSAVQYYNPPQVKIPE